MYFWMVSSTLLLQMIEHLNHNLNLQHIDLSDNNITCLGDIRGLTKLKVSIFMYTGEWRVVLYLSQLIINGYAILNLARQVVGSTTTSFLFFLLNCLNQWTYFLSSWCQNSCYFAKSDKIVFSSFLSQSTLFQYRFFTVLLTKCEVLLSRTVICMWQKTYKIIICYLIQQHANP